MVAELKRKYIGSRSFYRSALVVAMPIMIQTGITNFVSLLDNIMVGRIGTEAMTGVAIVNQLIFVLNLAIFGAVSGAGIFGAQFYGSGDHRGVRATLRYKLIISALIIALGTAVLLIFGDRLISLYLSGEGSEAEIAASKAYAKQYLMIMLFGLAPFAAAQCYSGTLRETGETMLPMKSGVASVMVNLVFNTILIYGLFGMPALGASGAAAATVISRFVEAFIVISWTHRHIEKNRFAEGLWKSMSIPRRLALDITWKGLPLLFNETFWAAGMAVLAQCYSTRGYDVVSAVNITSTITNVFGVSFMAMGMSIGIIIGQMLGAGKYDEAVAADRKLITFSVAVCIVAAVLMAAAAPFFPQIYNTSDSIRNLAVRMILAAAVCMPVNALANACYFTLRSGGKVWITVLFDSVYVWVFSVPVAFILSRFTSIPVVPLYFTCLSLEIGKCIIGVTMIRKGIWINNIVENQRTE
jgi:putative MATE family efflux protein